MKKTKRLIYRNIFGRVVNVEQGNNSSSGDTTSNIVDTPVGVYSFNEPLTEGYVISDAMWDNNELLQYAWNASYDYNTNYATIIDSTNGKVYTLHSNDGIVTVEKIEELKERTIYYDGLIESYVTFEIIPAFGPFSASVTEQLVSTPAYVRNATIHHNGDAYTVGIGTYDAETAVVSLTPGAYYKAMNDDAEGIEVLQITDPNDGVMEHPLYPVINFMGRFLAKVDNVSISLPQGINSAETNPDTEAGHTYEYSILDGVFSIIDVTPHVE